MPTTLCTTDELNAHVQREVDGEVAELALDLASGIVRAFCQWGISAEATTFTVDGSGHSVLSLPTLHLVSVEEVRLLGVPLVIGPESWSERGQLWRREGWPSVFRNVEVDCHHGYRPSEMPAAVRAVVLTIAAGRIHNTEGLRSKTVGDTSRTYFAPELSPLQMAQLAEYRMP